MRTERETSCNRREIPKTLQRYPSRMTSRAGTKLPVTPISRSARSFRADSARAARLISGAAPTTAPIARSTIHLPPNSFPPRRVVLERRRVGVARSRAPTALTRRLAEHLAAAQRGVDPFAGEWIEEVGRVADQRRTRRPRPPRVRRERTGRHRPASRAPRRRIAARDARAPRSHRCEKCRAIAGDLTRARRRNDERHRRESVADVGDADVAVALDVHLAVFADVAHVRVVRDERKTARPTQRLREAESSRDHRTKPVRARSRHRARISPRTPSFSVDTPSTRPSRVRTTSVTRTPSVTCAPAARARSRRIASSTSRRTDSPRSRKPRKPCAAMKSPVITAPFGARTRMPDERRGARLLHALERAHRPRECATLPGSNTRRTASGAENARGRRHARRTPARASANATDEPAGPPPTTSTSASLIRELYRESSAARSPPAALLRKFTIRCRAIRSPRSGRVRGSTIVRHSFRLPPARVAPAPRLHCRAEHRVDASRPQLHRVHVPRDSGRRSRGASRESR